MLKNIHILMIVLWGLLLTSCSMFYYGYTREEWNNLSEQTKLDVKKEYQRAIDTKKAQNDEETIENRTESIVDYGIKKSQQ